VRDQPPRGLQKGRIVGRQKTYWDLESGIKSWRVHFRGKRESRFVAPAFVGLAVSTDHPVLASHLEAQRRLLVSSKANNVEELISQLDEAVAQATSGWRTLSEYANPDVVPEAILEAGRGLLLQAPCSVAQLVGAALERADVQFESLEVQHPSCEVRALILGRNFVVAEHFEFDAPHVV